MLRMPVRHFVQLLCLSAVWGASFPLIRVAAPEFGAVPMACLRCTLAAVVLSGLMHLNRLAWPARSHWPTLAAVSVLTVVAPFVLFNWAGMVLPAGYSAVLNATAPMFGVLAGWQMAGERLTWRKIAGCICGLAGVSLLVGLGPVPLDWRTLGAVLACVAASAAYGVGAVLMKRSATLHEPQPASSAIHVVGAAGLLLPAVVAGLPDTDVPARAIGALLILGAFTSGLMYLISMRLLKEIPASAATSPAFMIPMFGIAWGAAFLGEPVTLGIVPGVALVLAAAAMVTGFRPLAWLLRR